MYFKVFGYGHNWEEVLEFIKWWIKSNKFSKDIIRGEKINGKTSVRDINHTIRIIECSEFELLIEKGIIASDLPAREMKPSEVYLNKGHLEDTGFNQAVQKIGEWLERLWDYDPYVIDDEKAMLISLEFDMIGVGFYICSNPDNPWKLHIVADTVGIPQ
jgi:hypothetical protein